MRTPRTPPAYGPVIHTNLLIKRMARKPKNKIYIKLMTKKLPTGQSSFFSMTNSFVKFEKKKNSRWGQNDSY